MLPGDVAGEQHSAESRCPAVIQVKVWGKERGSARGRGKPFSKTVSLSPSFFVHPTLSKDLADDGSGKQVSCSVIDSGDLPGRAGKVGGLRVVETDVQAVVGQQLHGGRDRTLAIAQSDEQGGIEQGADCRWREKEVGRLGMATTHDKLRPAAHQQGLTGQVLAEHIERLAMGDAEPAALAFRIAPEPVMPGYGAFSFRRAQEDRSAGRRWDAVRSPATLKKIAVSVLPGGDETYLLAFAGQRDVQSGGGDGSPAVLLGQTGKGEKGVL